MLFSVPLSAQAAAHKIRGLVAAHTMLVVVVALAVGFLEGRAELAARTRGPLSIAQGMLLSMAPRALGTMMIGQAMLLAMWIGMGISGGVRRLAALLAGTSWFAACLVLAQVAASRSRISWIEMAPWVLVWNLVGVAIFFVVFAFVRSFLAEVRWLDPVFGIAPESRSQLSIRQLMILTCCVGVFLAGARITSSTAGSGWSILLFLVLGIAVAAVSSVGALWAVLAPGAVTWRILYVLFFVVLLGGSLAVRLAESDTFSWITGSFYFVPPTLVEVLTLLYVRRLGYRLVPVQAAWTRKAGPSSESM